MQSNFKFLITLIFVLSSCDDSQNLITPDDGRDWQNLTENAPWSPRAGHVLSVSENGIAYISGGFENNNGTPTALSEVWSTDDGYHWSLVSGNSPWAGRTSHCSLWFKNRFYIIAGNNDSDYFNDVWVSDNGISWEDITPQNAFGERKGMTCTVFNDAIWMIGGVDYDGLNEIWKSTDGISWEKMTDPPFSPRSHHSAFIYKGRMWISGGSVYTSAYLSDTWSTPDGVNWTYEGELPQSVYGHCTVTGGAGIFTIGGNGNTDTILHSIDGKQWETIDGQNLPGARNYHSCAVLSGHFLVTGGSYTENLAIYLRNDVWISR
ncbi:MAG: hypothetical protein JXR95_13080 [Deltaproteobacteria bacterium]|nr:hypothetical protein [Deltaproteobacteria bacterium]